MGDNCKKKKSLISEDSDSGDKPLVDLSAESKVGKHLVDKSEETNIIADQNQASYLTEKFVFVLATIGLLGVSHAAVWVPWVIPAVFVIVTPFLLAVRAVVYWGNKWQFFLVDFCYFAMGLTYLYLCIPNNGELFQIVFAFANGPLLSATAVYGNALVFHRYDKMTSLYIHMVPGLLTFGMRWDPVSTSWLIRELRFSEVLDTAPSFNLICLYVAPALIYVLHTVCYCLLVNVIVCPKPPYLYSYNFLTEKYKNIQFVSGPLGRGILYYGLNMTFILSTLLLGLLCYSYFIFHCVFIAVVFLIAMWNGACYYIDVFSVKGFHDENDTG